MAEREIDRIHPTPTDEQPLSLTPAQRLRVTDGQRTIDLTADGDTLFLQVNTADEHSIFSAAVDKDNRVHLIFDPSHHANAQAPDLRRNFTKETENSPEYPPITVEGFAGRQGSYRQSDVRPGDMEYYVYLYYRPDPMGDWEYTIPYHLHFFGDAAEALKKQHITTGARLRASGELHTNIIKDKQGREKPRYDVYAEKYEFWKGKPKPMPNETRRRSSPPAP